MNEMLMLYISYWLANIENLLKIRKPVSITDIFLRLLLSGQ